MGTDASDSVSTVTESMAELESPEDDDSDDSVECISSDRVSSLLDKLQAPKPSVFACKRKTVVS